jgi:hypothetical protein
MKERITEKEFLDTVEKALYVEGKQLIYLGYEKVIKGLDGKRNVDNLKLEQRIVNGTVNRFDLREDPNNPINCYGSRLELYGEGDTEFYFLELSGSNKGYWECMAEGYYGSTNIRIQYEKEVTDGGTIYTYTRTYKQTGIDSGKLRMYFYIDNN